MDSADKNASRGIARGLLAGVVVVGFFACLITLFVLPTEGNAGLQGAQLLLIGTLQTTFGAVVGYYFGSTSGSDKKTELLAKSTPLPDNPVLVTTTADTPLGRSTATIVPNSLQRGVVISYSEGVAMIQTADGEVFSATGDTQVGAVVTFRDGVIESSEAPPVVQSAASSQNT